MPVTLEAGKTYVAMANGVIGGGFNEALLLGMPNRIFGIMTNETLIAVPVFVFMGVAMEYLQGLGPVRMFEYADMIANTAGVLLGLLLSLTRARNVLVWIEARLF